jgi:hypothetical protein
MAMIAITTSSSMRVKPVLLLLDSMDHVLHRRSRRTGDLCGKVRERLVL